MSFEGVFELNDSKASAVATFGSVVTFTESKELDGLFDLDLEQTVKGYGEQLAELIGLQMFPTLVAHLVPGIECTNSSLEVSL
jgi:hypothetical protein